MYPVGTDPHFDIRFCRRCGSAVQHRLPDDGDQRVRAVCPACGTVHYVNPLLVVGTLPLWQDKVLLCLRNIEPRKGYWTLPAGFMEMGETASQGAARETIEEAGAQFELGPLFCLISVPSVGQVHVFYRCRLSSDVFAAGAETQETRLFAPEEIPWGAIAFSTVGAALRAWLQERQQARCEAVHVLDMAP